MLAWSRDSSLCPGFGLLKVAIVKGGSPCPEDAYPDARDEVADVLLESNSKQSWNTRKIPIAQAIFSFL